ncbi:acyl-CoA dehydrogenase family protein [Rhodococcus sovatensis]|uniref:Acyl-CoA dehydrogenase family protein n=1 Tax=Rhodococcus sovatensis TaxID=1805840 RepID=A0ABZ2PHU3_9NOCA
MNLNWGEDHSVLVEVAKSVFPKYSPLVDRANSVSYADQLAQFRDLDWLQLGDATGLSSECAALGSIAGIFVEMGYALVDTPLLDLTIARDVAMVLATDASTKLAESIGSGAASVIPVLGREDWGSQLNLENGILRGTALAVAYAENADSFLVEAVEGSETVVAIVDAGSGSTVAAMPNIGRYPLFAVTFEDAPVTADSILARGASADAALEVATQRAAVLRAAQVHGAGKRLLDITVRYAQERNQFGGPIGRFQAVQYLCTDMTINVHLTSAYVRAAANAIDNRAPSQPHLALMCKQAAETAREMVHSAHEVHAGMGYMVESNVHLFTNAAKRWQYDFGTDATNDALVTSAVEHIYAGAGL